MKKLILAAALALVAAPAFAVGPESFTVDVSRMMQQGGSQQPAAQAQQAQEEGTQASQHASMQRTSGQAMGDEQPASPRSKRKAHRSRAGQPQGQAPAAHPAAAAPAGQPAAPSHQ